MKKALKKKFVARWGGRMQALCRICLEDIENNICSTCLFEQIYGWLKSRASHMVPVMLTTHKNLIALFPQTEDNVEKCILCEKETSKVFCPYCYTREIYYALSRKDREVGKEMIELFNFDFQNLGYDHQNKIVHIPLRFADVGFGFIEGQCELCNNYSDYLADDGGELICAECRGA